MNWNEYFISLFAPISEKSKDPSTKVSCILVGKNKEIKGTGFNGFPIGVSDREERYLDRELKYKFVSHAESNAIAFAARNGVALDGCSIFISHPPCITCSKLIIQAGIKKVFVDKRNITEDLLSRWRGEFQFSKIMFEEAKVDYNEI